MSDGSGGGPEDRIDGLVVLLTRLAGGDLDARGALSGADDDLDAVMVGINMLAEELQANRSDLEGRVRVRTAEVEQLNHDILQLTELGNVLQACVNRDEAYAVITQAVTEIFAGLSGVMYLFNASRNLLERKVAWGRAPAGQVLLREDCWALRRGQRHVVLGGSPRLSCPHVEARTGDSICIPMAAQGETVGLLHLMVEGAGPVLVGQPLSTAKQQLAVAVAEQTALALSNLELRETLRIQALRDPLTGLFNRRFVDDWIAREVNRAERTGTSLGVIMADVDNFKQVNDLHGHDAGDCVLVAIANVMRSHLRAGDLPCRYGGEEFLVLVPDITEGTLLARAEELRAAVARTNVEYQGVLLPAATISAGVARYPQDGVTPAEVIRAADTALYTAKRAGRDRVATISTATTT